MAVTSTQLLEKIKRAVTVPASQIRFSDANLLEFADEETEATILPMLLSLRQEYLVKSRLVPIVEEQAAYKIPYRAIGRNLRELKLVTSDGQFIKSLAHITLEDSQRFSPNIFGEPLGFTIQGENVVLLPTPESSNGSYNIKMYYELAPGALIDPDEAGVITAFDLDTGIVTIASAIAGFASTVAMDIIDAKTGNSTLAEGITNVSVSGTTITFTAADLPSDMSVGDYVTLAGETPVIQLPEELHQALVQAVVCRILEAQGDFEGLQAAEAKLEKKITAAQVLLTPRVEGNPLVVINRNGLLRQRPYNYRFRYII